MDFLILVKNNYLEWSFWLRFFTGQSDHVLWNNRNYRLFLLSECVGIFGGHFYSIALPWMVMQYTRSAAAMSTALVLTGLSRLAFMMVGGMLTDKFSPRTLIMASGILRIFLLLVITGFAVAGQMSLVALYIFSFACGFTDAIYTPSRGAVMPRLVERDQLKLANSIAYAQEKFWGLLGPVLAGVVITAISYMGGLDGTAIKALVGPAAAFVIDILAIVSSVLLLRRVRFSSPEALESTDAALSPDKVAAEVPAPPAAQGSLRGLLLLLRQQVGLRMSFLMVYGINLITSGPLYIGMPMLAVSRFSEGAQALGFMNSALGFGALIGTLLAGVLPQPKPQSVGKLIFGILGGLAAGGATLLLVISVGVDAAAVSFLAGLVSYVNVVGIVQIQRDTPPEFMGRMMGLINMK